MTDKLVRLPPHSVDAEKAVLGSVFLDPNCLASVSDVIDASMFYRTAHRQIFEAMHRMAAKGADINWITVEADMAEAGTLESAGGRDYLVQCTEAMATSASVGDWASIVAEKWKCRLIQQASITLADRATMPGVRSEDLLSDWTKWLTAANGSTGSAPMTEDSAQAYVESECNNLANGVLPSALDTGHPMLASIMIGWEPGSLHVISAETGAGKTYFAFQLLQRTVEMNEGAKAGLVSLEMDARELYRRQVIGTRAYADVISGRPPDVVSIQERIERFRQFPVLISSPEALSPDAALMGIMRMIQAGCSIIALDLLQAIIWPSKDSTTRIAEFTSRVKQMASKHRVVIILISQLNRPATKGKPRSPFSFSTDDTFGHEGAYAVRAAHTASLIARPFQYAGDSMCDRILFAVGERYPDLQPDQLNQLRKRLVVQRVAKNRAGGGKHTVFWWSCADGGLLPPIREDSTAFYQAIRGDQTA